jgi:uncharacterized protein
VEAHNLVQSRSIARREDAGISQLRKIDTLAQIQDVDTRLDALRTAMAQLQAEIGQRTALDRRQAELDAVNKQMHDLRTQQRDLELQVEERRTKMKADETKLYSGKVTSPKELGSLNDEIAQEKRQIGTLEDKLLAIFEQTEVLEAEARQLSTSLESETKTWNARQEQLRARLNEAEQDSATLTARRTAVLENVEPAARSTYDSLRRQKGGVAVSLVSQRTCQSCRVSLTASIEQRARIGADLITCPSCGRILFVPLT